MKKENQSVDVKISDVATAAQQMLDKIVTDLTTSPKPYPEGEDGRAARVDGETRLFFPEGIELIDVIVDIAGANVEVKIGGPGVSVTNVPSYPTIRQTPRDINVCDDNKPASPGDPITWHNLRGFPVMVYFDTVDGCPLDECPFFCVPANGKHTNYVRGNAALASYQYRVDPACAHGINPKIIIQAKVPFGADRTGYEEAITVDSKTSKTNASDPTQPVRDLLDGVVSELRSTAANKDAAEPRLFFPNGIELIHVIVKVNPVDVEVTIAGPEKSRVSSSSAISRTPHDVNVCDDEPARAGDPITWHNLRGVPVTVYFDTADGCPLDDSPSFCVPAHGTHQNNVRTTNVTPGNYHYRVDPACSRPTNPKIIIQ